MKFTAKRLLGAGVIGIAAIVTPHRAHRGASGGQQRTLLGGGSVWAFDQILFNQPTSGADSFQYRAEPRYGVGAPGGQHQRELRHSHGRRRGDPLRLWGGVLVARLQRARRKRRPWVRVVRRRESAPFRRRGRSTTSRTRVPRPSTSHPGRHGSRSARTVSFDDAQIPVQRKDTGNSGIGQRDSCSWRSSLPDPPPSRLAPICSGHRTARSRVIRGRRSLSTRTAACRCLHTDASDQWCRRPRSRPSKSETSRAARRYRWSARPQPSSWSARSAVARRSPPSARGWRRRGALELPPVAPGTPPVCKSYTSFTSDRFDPNTGLSTLGFNGFSTGTCSSRSTSCGPPCRFAVPTSIRSGTRLRAGPRALRMPLAWSAVQQQTCARCTVRVQRHAASTTRPTARARPRRQGLASRCSRNCAPSPRTTTTTFVNADGTVALNASGNPVPITTSTNVAGTQIVENWAGDVDMRLH